MGFRGFAYTDLSAAERSGGSFRTREIAPFDLRAKNSLDACTHTHTQRERQTERERERERERDE